MTDFDERGVWRDLHTGVDPLFFADPTWADGATDQPGTPAVPIDTRLDGPWGFPWFDGVENPFAATGLFATADPQIDVPDLGAEPIVGAYEPAFYTHGPVRAWGHEPSGGLTGDQAYNRVMRFPANIPDRYDKNGVWNLDPRDELAATLTANEQPVPGDYQINDSLVLWPNVMDY